MNIPLDSQIFDLLNEINRSPDFYTYQSSKAFFPQLNIDDLGELSLPLCEAQAQQLIKLCIKAPYGKGKQTLVDEKVRKVWELDATKISNGNKAWQSFISQTLRGCEQNLDLQGQTLIAHPYKLLLYEKDSFFLAHQDTEKEEGMVATLVVAFPSDHQGGELTIAHHNKAVCVDFSKEEKRYYFQSLLFYADCHHQISPVKKGYRLVLTYNVCLKGQRELSTFDFSTQQQTLSRLFRDWSNHLKTTDKKHLIISLDHQYSAAGFSLDSLKGIDRSRADVLLHSAEQADCNAYICLLERYELFTAWEEDELDELIEDSISIHQLIDSTGHKIKMTLSHIQEIDILQQKELDEEEAIEEDYEGYMGNYGNTLSRWYRHAAVILWPKKDHLELLACNNIDTAITYLKHQHKNKDVNFPQDLHSLLLLVDNKQCSSRDENFVLLTLILSQKKNNKELAKRYCQYFLFTQSKSPTSAKKIQQIIELCSWAHLEKSLDLKEANLRLHLFEVIDKIKAHLVWNEHSALEKLFYKAITESTEDLSWRSDASHHFELIFTLCLELPTKKSANALANFLNKQGKRLTAESDILPYLEKQFSNNANPKNTVIFDGVTHWLDQQFLNYQQRIKQKPEPALIEVIPNINNCSCSDCKEILSFMKSKAEVIELGKLKAQCEHLSSQVQLHTVQVIDSINKRRRPWRFTMRKLGADQRAKIAKYKIAKSYMDRLEKLR